MAFGLSDGTLKSLPMLLFLFFFVHLLVLLEQVHFHSKMQGHTPQLMQHSLTFQQDSNCPLSYDWQKALLSSMHHLFSSMFAAHASLLQMDFPYHGNNQKTLLNHNRRLGNLLNLLLQMSCLASLLFLPAS